ncbi:MAG: helix-turn-helix transcriptional regulator [Gemmatimonadales bacterium]
MRASQLGRHVVLYGLIGGLFIAALRVIEYRWLVVEHSVEIYGALVAAVFAAVGIWIGLRVTARREKIVVREVPVRVEVPVSAPFEVDTGKLAALGITPRELEILSLIAAGLSTREIAGRIYVSENTVKTHSSRVFSKLGARRRTQAVQLAKEYRLLP